MAALSADVSVLTFGLSGLRGNEAGNTSGKLHGTTEKGGGKMQKPRKIPQRQCVGCRTMKDKKSLIRVVRSPEGEISLDFRGKKPGRGAYVCPDPACLKKARKSRALERAFETEIPQEVYDEMDRQMEEQAHG